MLRFGCKIFFLLFYVSQCLATSEDRHKCTLPEVVINETVLDLDKVANDFSKISEVKFPGVIGPLNEKLICKIKCIEGKWVGPLCSTTTDGRYQPLFRKCVYTETINPLLLVSYKNSSLENGTLLSHGSIVTVRCNEFGIYKLKGENIIRCHNGEWTPDLPSCVPTTLITNYTEDAPPSILYKLSGGSAWFEYSGELWLFPESTLTFDCISIRADQDPVWSWTQLIAHYPTGWSSDPEENNTHYQLTLERVSARHSDQYTCASPNGKTNTVTVKVVNVVCPQLEVKDKQLIQIDEGIRLGQSIRLSCKPGYKLNGSATLTCMGNGRWSGGPPTCVEMYCPMPKWSTPHLSLVEYNSSIGGRATFQCAWGYKLIGELEIECMIDEKWSGTPPACAAIYCPKPVIPDNGFIISGAVTERHSVGDLITYACPETMDLVGESSVLCTESGFWSHPPPFCFDSAHIRNETHWNSTSIHDVIFVDNITFVQYLF